jgi:hypothetical protein
VTDWHAPIFGANGQVKVYFEIATYATGWQMNEDVSVGETELSIVVADLTNFPIYSDVLADDIIQVDDEDMVATADRAGSLVNVSRGFAGTTDTTHNDGTGVRHFRDYTSRLVNAKVPKFKSAAEKKLNSNVSVRVKLEMDNRDGKWFDPDWFGTWRGRLVRFYFGSPEESRHGTGTSSPDSYVTTMATYQIDDVQPGRETAVISLVSIDTPLRKREGQDSATAEKVRDKGWIQNASAKQLIRALLGNQYNSTREAPPEYWMEDIPDSMEISVSGSFPRFSHYGRLPEWDGGVKLEHNKIVRAIALDTTNNRLYYGSDDEFWYRDLSTNVDTQVSAAVSAGFDIVRLWASTQEPGTIWGVALSPALHRVTAGTSDHQPEQYMKLFKYTGSGSVTVYAQKTIVSGYLTSGQFIELVVPYRGDHADEKSTLPFEQFVRPSPTKVFGSNTVTNETENVSIYDGAGGAEAFSVPQTGGFFLRGYRAIVTIDESGTMDMSELSSLWTQGQQGALAYDANVGTEGAIFFITKSVATNQHILLNKFLCSSEVFSVASDTTMEEEQPTSMHAGNGKVFIGTFQFVNLTGAGNNPSHSYVRRYESNTLTYEALTWSGDDENTVLEIIGDDTNSELHWSAMNRHDWYSESQPYTIHRKGYADTGATSNLDPGPYGVVNYSAQPCGFIAVPDAVSSNYILWGVTGDGAAMRYNRGSRSWVLVQNSDELIENEPYTTGALAVTAPSTKGYVVYGVSSPVPSWYTQEGTPDSPAAGAGKYFFWKIGTTIADRYALADFSGWSLGDALDRIANVQQRTWGFGARGKFQFDELPAPNPADADYVINTHTGDPSNTIYAPWLKDPVVSLGFSEIANTATAVPYVVKLGEISNPALKLSGASPLRGDQYGEDANGNPIKLPVIEISSSAIFPVRVVLRCIRAGKLLNETTAQNPQFRVITDLPTINLVLTRKTTPGSGVLYVDRVPLKEDGELMFEASADANQGDFITVGDREYFEISDRKISAASVEDGTITVDPVINDTNDPDTNPYPAGTAIVITPRESGLNPSKPIVTFVDGVGQEVIEGVFVKMSAGTDSSGVAVVDDETPIGEGDTLVIEVPGLKLEKAERSIQTKVNSLSIRKYDKREPRLPENRLLSKATAFELAVSHVNRHAFPHLLLKGGVWRLMPWLKPMDTIRLTDPVIMRHVPGGYDILFVQSVTHDTTAGTTTVDLRGLRDIDTDAP